MMPEVIGQWATVRLHRIPIKLWWHHRDDEQYPYTWDVCSSKFDFLISIYYILIIFFLPQLFPDTPFLQVFFDGRLHIYYLPSNILHNSTLWSSRGQMWSHLCQMQVKGAQVLWARETAPQLRMLFQRPQVQYQPHVRQLACHPSLQRIWGSWFQRVPTPTYSFPHVCTK